MEVTMKVILLVICLLLVFSVSSIAPNQAIAQADESKGVPPTWLQVNPEGLGENNWHVPSMAAFGKFLYSGTWRTDYKNDIVKAQIWRTDDSKNWNKVFEVEDIIIADLIVFKEYLYAGSWSGKVWRSKDGLTWKNVKINNLGGFDNGITQFSVSEKELYASTWNWMTGTKIWRTHNGMKWELFVDVGLIGDTYNGGTISSEVFKGQLYWGICCNYTTGAQLWRTDGITTEAVVVDGFGDPKNGAVSTLASFGSYLYAGVVNGNGTIQIWRSPNGVNWTQSYVSNDSVIGVVDTMEAYHEYLYLVTQNVKTGMEISRTTNGIDWQQVVFDGSGNKKSQTSFWENVMPIYPEGMYIAAKHSWTRWGL